MREKFEACHNPNRRLAALYADGSLGVEASCGDLETARKRLLGSCDDHATRIVEVAIRIVADHGSPPLQAATEYSALCPLWRTEVFIEVPDPVATAGER